MNRSVTFGMASPTLAYKANNLLKVNGFNSSVVKLGSSMESGCIYGVAVTGDTDSAEILLIRSGLTPKSVRR